MDPILIEFPERIETERLYMRPALPGDGKTVHEAVSASAAELKNGFLLHRMNNQLMKLSRVSEIPMPSLFKGKISVSIFIGKKTMYLSALLACIA